MTSDLHENAPLHDEIMAEVRERKEALAAECGYDVRRILTRATEQAQAAGVVLTERAPRRVQPADPPA